MEERKYPSKDLVQIWLDNGWNINGVFAFKRRTSKYFPSYTDSNGEIHQAQEKTFEVRIDFNLEKKTFVFSTGIVEKEIFIPQSRENFSVGVDTLRLICKTVKELGW